MIQTSMIQTSKLNSEQIYTSLPDKYEQYSIETQQLIVKYLNQLDNKEQIAYLIAKEHLGTSFDIVKSIGYIEWKKKQNDA
jgi:hypothetical protein|uniref:Uncharacterized protein n=1 Tax=viral metagenome TaxID=1070528 RepID=A0A6C0DAI2_9ZZZZ